MLSVEGIYTNGELKLLEPVSFPNKARVIVTIIENLEENIIPQENRTEKSFIGALPDVGETIGDLTKPFNDEWEID
jgi:predicted DNA-binding antitoxin AbrB/MazE fold protein